MRHFLLSVFLVTFGVAYVSCKPWKSKFGKSVPFKDCGSALANVSALTVDPCTDNPCTLHKGKNSTITVTFTVNEGVPDITGSKAVVHGILAGVAFPFPLTNDNGCKNCGLTCPMKAQGTYTYKYTLPISTSFPSVDCVVKWELAQTSGKAKNGDNEIFCIELPVKVK